MKDLSHLLMQLYEPNISEEGYSQRYNSYIHLYKLKMEKYNRKWISRVSLSAKKRLHDLIAFLFRANAFFKGFTHEVISDKHSTINRPVIYAVTHIGKFDIEILGNVIKDHVTVLSSDFERLSGTLDGFFISLNGVLFFNHLDKGDRKKVSERMVATLRAGDNLMYFPEGAWNMSPNLPMLPCFWGIVDVAKQGNADIVPVAIEQYGKHFKINIGSNINFESYGSSVEDKTECISLLRDSLATLKWEIWETEPIHRADIESNYWQQYQKSRFSEWPFISRDCIQTFGTGDNDSEFVRFNQMYIGSLTFKPKGSFGVDEAFAHLHQISPSLNSAFLFNKQNHF